MYRTVYSVCLAINLISAHGFSGFDCTESDTILTEKNRKNKNTTQFIMHTFTEDLLRSRNLTAAILASNGCPLELEIDAFNNTFYIECETKVNCLDDDEDIAIKTIDTFFLNCEDISFIDDNSTHNTSITEFIGKKAMYVTSDKMAKEDKPTDTRKLVIIASSVAAGLATVVGFAAALYHLQTILQSGTYLFPNTPSPTGFSEMA